MWKIVTILLIGLMTLFVPTLPAQEMQAGGKAENTGQFIAYLIGDVAGSRLTFIRNGERHSSEEAANHIRKKYEYFKYRIESPEDFIRLCAAKSLISGKPYLVVTHQGEVPVEKWLGQLLAARRKTRGTLGNGPPRKGSE